MGIEIVFCALIFFLFCLLLCKKENNVRKLFSRFMSTAGLSRVRENPTAHLLHKLGTLRNEDATTATNITERLFQPFHV